MEHTPGPWTIRESVTKPERDFAIMAHGGIIAEAFERGGRRHETRIEVEANAKLIAAAPELLSALERLCKGHNVRGSDGPCDCVGCRVLDELRSA